MIASGKPGTPCTVQLSRTVSASPRGHGFVPIMARHVACYAEHGLRIQGGTMVFFVLPTLLSWLVDLGTLRFQSDRDKDLEILLLRRQLAILQRTQPQPPRLTRWEKLGLAVLVARLRRCRPARASACGSVWCSSRQRRSCADTANWCGASGRSAANGHLVGRPSARRSSS
jgi:hypothetical protein